MEIPKISSIPSLQNQTSSDQANYQANSHEKGQTDNEAQGELSKQKLDDKVKSMNQLMEQSKLEVKFQLYDKTGEYYLQMIDTKTGDVVGEIPSKKILDYFSNLNNLKGLSVDKRI